MRSSFIGRVGSNPTLSAEKVPYLRHFSHLWVKIFRFFIFVRVLFGGFFSKKSTAFWFISIELRDLVKKSREKQFKQFKERNSR